MAGLHGLHRGLSLPTCDFSRTASQGFLVGKIPTPGLIQMSSEYITLVGWVIYRGLIPTQVSRDFTEYTTQVSR